MGFNIHGDILFPELTINKGRPSYGLLVVEHLEEPFTNLDSTLLERYLDPIIINSVTENIKNINFTPYSRERGIAPLYLELEIDKKLTRAVRFILNNDGEIPLYTKDADMLYLPLTFEETFTQNCLISE